MKKLTRAFETDRSSTKWWRVDASIMGALGFYLRICISVCRRRSYVISAEICKLSCSEKMLLLLHVYMS